MRFWLRTTIDHKLTSLPWVIEVYRKILGLSPNSVGLHRDIGIALSFQGKRQEAVAEVIQLHSPGISAGQAVIYARAGLRVEALKLLGELKERDAHERVSPVTFARVYVGLGDKEQALAQLRKAYQEQSDHLLQIGTDPMLDPLRSDPRFIKMLRRVGLTP